MKKILFLTYIIFIVIVTSCSINRFATRLVADALTGNGRGSVFTTDDDPEFIAAALPFALKTFESLLQSDSANAELLESIAGGYVSYANGFLQSPAELLGFDKIKEKEHLFFRAAAMYRRGGTYASKGLELLYPGFESYFSIGDWKSAFINLKADSVPFLYWKAAAILGEFSVDSFNPELMVKIPQAVALAARALELEDNYNQGALQNLFISVFANLPESLIYRINDADSDYSVIKVLKTYYADRDYINEDMSMDDQAMFYFDLSLKISDGTNVSPFVSISSMFIKNQDLEGFEKALHGALDINIDLNPENRLPNIINQQKAKWLLDNKEDYFFIP